MTDVEEQLNRAIEGNYLSTIVRIRSLIDAYESGVITGGVGMFHVSEVISEYDAKWEEIMTGSDASE